MNHIERILAYYPMVREGSDASVWLTFEDWQVLYDLLFRTPDAAAHLPEDIEEFRLLEGEAVILLEVADCHIRVEMAG